MPRVCTVCTHPERRAIDKVLMAGEPAPAVSATWGVSPDSVKRHKAAHLPVRLVQQQTLDEAKDALDVVQQLKAINAASLQVLREARANGQGGLALAAVDRIQRQIELQAKLLGELDDRPLVNVLVSPEWHQVRGVILEALSPYPQARAAVSARLLAATASSGWRLGTRLCRLSRP